MDFIKEIKRDKRDKKQEAGGTLLRDREYYRCFPPPLQAKFAVMC
jgi:hypothetical protein